MRQTIQEPFTDAGQSQGTGERVDSWSEEEREMLLIGIGKGLTFAQIAEQITDELNDRTPKAVQDQWDRMRALYKTQ